MARLQLCAAAAGYIFLLLLLVSSVFAAAAEPDPRQGDYAACNRMIYLKGCTPADCASKCTQYERGKGQCYDNGQGGQACWCMDDPHCHAPPGHRND